MKDTVVSIAKYNECITKEKYAYRVMCDNCEETSWVAIPKGMPVINFIESNRIICGLCNCDIDNPKIPIKPNVKEA